MKTRLRTHWIFRAYIAAARNERYEPQHYTLEMGRSERLGGVTDPECGTLCWDEPKKMSRLVYQLYGYSGREQFTRGIIEQPSWLANRLICLDLRQAFGDLSNVPGFNEQSVLELTKGNDLMMPVFEGKRIVRIEAYRSYQLAKRLKAA